MADDNYDDFGGDDDTLKFGSFPNDLAYGDEGNNNNNTNNSSGNNNNNNNNNNSNSSTNAASSSSGNNNNNNTGSGGSGSNNNANASNSSSGNSGSSSGNNNNNNNSTNNNSNNNNAGGNYNSSSGSNIDSENKPKILLMGLRRSGKSSIQKVVFQKMSPNETLFLESTNKIIKTDISSSSFVQFQVWDFPGQIDYFDPTFNAELMFGHCGAMIFVIDAQDDYSDALSKLHVTVMKAYKVNPNISFEIFIHKVDGLSDDHKIDCQRDIHQQATEDLADAKLENIHLSFYLTSIYDHSVFEAFSKVIQKLIPQLPTLENLLDILVGNCRIEKAFLFDVVSKIYIATDSSPVDMQTYELCSDMIDVVIDVSCIYGLGDAGNENFAYDNESQSIIKLNNGMVLYLREVTKYLALVCLLREEHFNKHGLLMYNFQCLKQAIADVFDVTKKNNMITAERKAKRQQQQQQLQQHQQKK